MKLGTKILIGAGFTLFIVGWAVRSTYLMDSYTNKPLGAIMISLGCAALAIILWKGLKKYK